MARVRHCLPPGPPRKADSSGIPGPARGREGLIRDLQDDMIPYTPEQLIALANKEFAWCEKEMKKASREMGFGDDWKKAALEKTKTMHVPPGGQPAMIRDLIFQAIAYLRANDLVTVPEVAAESQHMTMMSPQAQLSNPFFLGGVADPGVVSDRRDGIRRAHAEHARQQPAVLARDRVPRDDPRAQPRRLLWARFNDYRANLGAGGPVLRRRLAALLGTDDVRPGLRQDAGAEGRRAVLAHAPLRAHHLLAQVPHGPVVAAGIRRLPGGSRGPRARQRHGRSAPVVRGRYGPLYQAAYLLGGLQLRGLRRELVDSKQMTEKAFHDEILRQGSMPIALLRLALTKAASHARHGDRLEVLRRLAGAVSRIFRRGSRVEGRGSRVEGRASWPLTA